VNAINFIWGYIYRLGLYGRIHEVMCMKMCVGIWDIRNWCQVASFNSCMSVKLTLKEPRSHLRNGLPYKVIDRNVGRFVIFKLGATGDLCKDLRNLRQIPLSNQD